MSKYKIPVYIETTAIHYIGEIECESAAEFIVKAGDLWEEKNYDYPTANRHCDFDLGDWGIMEIKESDLKYFNKAK